MAKLGRRVAKLERWVAKLREMGGKVGSAPACYSGSLGSNPDNSQNYKMGDISKGVANTISPAKKYTKKQQFFRLEISGLKQRLKQAEADKKRLELKVTTKKEQLIEAKDKLNARDR